MANTQNSGCLAAFLGLFRRSQSQVLPPDDVPASEALPDGPLPYRLRDDFLSPAEASLYHILVATVGAQAVVCPKVSLRDIVFVASQTDRRSHQNRIAQKHVDFLICRAGTMRPIVAVELDDASHQRADRQERDALLEAVFAAAALPLVRIPAQATYHTQDIAEQLAPYLSGSEEADRTAPNAVTSDTAVSRHGPPTCPKCDVPMVLRTASHGKHQGAKFYGCVNFPRCREMQPVPQLNA